MDAWHAFVVFCLCLYASSTECTKFKNVVAVKIQIETWMLLLIWAGNAVWTKLLIPPHHPAQALFCSVIALWKLFVLEINSNIDNLMLLVEKSALFLVITMAIAVSHCTMSLFTLLGIYFSLPSPVVELTLLEKEGLYHCVSEL